MKALHDIPAVPAYETETGANGAVTSRVEAADVTEHHIVDWIWPSFSGTPTTRPKVQILEDDVVVFVVELDAVVDPGPVLLPKDGFIGKKGSKIEVKILTAGAAIATTMNTAIR